MVDVKKSLKGLVDQFKKTQPQPPKGVESMIQQQEAAKKLSEELEKEGVK